MTKSTMTRNKQIVIANTARSLVPYASQALAIGATKLGPTGAQLIWNGINWIGRKAWNRWNERKKQDVIVHPGVGPGAIAAPVSYARRIAGSKPKFQRSAGTITVTHREYVNLVRGNGASDFLVNNGDVVDYRVNPYNASLFAWLPTIASNFDQYRFRNIKFSYVPLCATTEVGRVALYFDKDSQDEAPTDRADVANYPHLSELSPWAEQTLVLPTDNTKRFINDSSTVDSKLVDLGRFGFATYGNTLGSLLGDIFVQYTVELFEAQPSANLLQEIVGNGLTVNTTLSRGINYAEIDTGSSITSLQYWIKSPGRYFYCWTANTGLGTAVAAYNGGLIKVGNDFSVSSTARDAVVGCFIAPRTGGRLDINSIVSLTNWQLTLTKAESVSQNVS